MATAPVLCIDPGRSYINPFVENVGVSELRKLNSRSLRDLDKTLLIHENRRPIAVLVKYEEYLELQTQRMSAIELLMNREEIAALASGLRDLRDGRTRPISEIRASLAKKGE